MAASAQMYRWPRSLVALRREEHSLKLWLPTCRRHAGSFTAVSARLIKRHPMIAVRWREFRHSTDPMKPLPATDATKTIATPFQPLDPQILSKAIPTFFVGQNSDGFWVVREAEGRIGGLFLFKGSALWFVKHSTRTTGCATVFLSEKFELDLKNRGNTLVFLLVPLLRLATEIKRRLGNFHIV
jgi:hypothetical protein